MRNGIPDPAFGRPTMCHTRTLRLRPPCPEEERSRVAIRFHSTVSNCLYNGELMPSALTTSSGFGEKANQGAKTVTDDASAQRHHAEFRIMTISHHHGRSVGT